MSVASLPPHREEGAAPPPKSDLRARSCSFHRRWSPVAREGIAGFPLDWQLPSDRVPYSVRLDRSAILFRWYSLGSLETDPRVPATVPHDATWLVLWRQGEPGPAQLVVAPMSGGDTLHVFSVVEADLDSDGEDELIVAADHTYSTIGSRRWTIAIIDAFHSDRLVAIRSSFTFEPEEYSDVSAWETPAEQFFELVDGRCVFHEREWLTGSGGVAAGSTGGERHLYRYRNGRLDSAPWRVVRDFVEHD